MKMMALLTAALEAAKAIAEAKAEKNKIYRIQTYVDITKQIHAMQNDIERVTSSHSLDAARLMRVDQIKVRIEQLRVVRSSLGDPENWR